MSFFRQSHFFVLEPQKYDMWAIVACKVVLKVFLASTLLDKEFFNDHYGTACQIIATKYNLFNPYFLHQSKSDVKFKIIIQNEWKSDILTAKDFHDRFNTGYDIAKATKLLDLLGLQLHGF